MASCHACTSQDRLKIDRALTRNQPLATISRKYGISIKSLSRHNINHLNKKRTGNSPATLDNAGELFEKFVARADLTTADGVLRFAQYQVYRLERIVDRAEEDGDLRTAVNGLKASLSAVNDLFAKHVGLLTTGPMIDQSTKMAVVLSGYSESQLRSIAEKLVHPEDDGENGSMV